MLFVRKACQLLLASNIEEEKEFGNPPRILWRSFGGAERLGSERTPTTCLYRQKGVERRKSVSGLNFFFVFRLIPSWPAITAVGVVPICSIGSTAVYRCPYEWY